MRNLLALVGLGGVLFLGAGYYKGWFTLENDSGKLNIEVNTDKAKKDIELMNIATKSPNNPA